RRRHTRSKRDWSSDVCSSDLEEINQKLIIPALSKFKSDSKTLIFCGELSHKALLRSQEPQRICLKNFSILPVQFFPQFLCGFLKINLGFGNRLFKRNPRRLYGYHLFK